MQGPVRFLGMEDFLSLIPCRQDSSLHDLLWVPKGGRVANQRRSSNETTWGRGSSTLGYGSPRTLHRPYACQQPHPLETVEERRMQDCHCLDPHHTLLPDYSLSLLTREWGHSSWGASLLWPPFAWQSSGLPWWLSWKRICLQCGRPGFKPWVGKIPWRREWLPTPVFWPG